MSVFSPKKLQEIFSFLKTEYAYHVEDVLEPGFNGIAVVFYEKEGSNSIKVEQERGYIDISIKIGEGYYALAGIYRYLYPDKIIRASYSQKEHLKFIEPDTKEYLNCFLMHREEITEDKYKAFYKEHPGYQMEWL